MVLLSAAVIVIGVLWYSTTDRSPSGWQILISVVGASLALVLVWFMTDVPTRRSLIRITASIEKAVSSSADEVIVSTSRAETNSLTVRLQTAAERLVAEKEALSNANKRFSARLAHELRTPLTILKGENQVMLARRRTVEDYEEQIRSNLEEVQRMEKTIDELLLLAKCESGAEDLEFAPVRLFQIAEAVVGNLGPLAEKLGVDIRLNSAIAMVMGEGSLLERLARNLVENGLYYTPKGGSVEVTVARENGYARLTVEDTGIGISKEDMPFLFDQFFRSPNARSHRPTGTGLGLSFAKRIADMHRAEIAISSRLGKGTLVNVVFPSIESEKATNTLAKHVS